MFGLFCVLLFTFRFFIEFLKENQESFEDQLPLNMGQILSIPFIIVGIYFILKSKNKKTI
jgi:prolipoprotein diacylglyceryltransferase